MRLHYVAFSRPQNVLVLIAHEQPKPHRIRDGAKAVGCPEPAFEVGNFVTVTFRPNPEVRQIAAGNLGSTPQVARQVGRQVTPQVTPQVAEEVRLLQAISGEMTARQVRDALNLADREHFRTGYLLPALQAGLIEMTIPDKPRSRLQRYRLTTAGRAHLQQALRRK